MAYPIIRQMARNKLYGLTGPDQEHCLCAQISKYLFRQINRRIGYGDGACTNCSIGSYLLGN